MTCDSGLPGTKDRRQLCKPLGVRLTLKGFSLIEVLISIIILSFGLLGMVGLQAAALQANRDARLQSVATTLGRELAEKMRGNKAVAVLLANPYLGMYSNPAGTAPLTHATPSYCLNVDGVPLPPPATSACLDTTDIARAEMTGWLAKVDNALPGARVEVCVDPAPYDANGLPQWSLCNSAGAGTLVIKIGWTRNSTNRDNTGDQAFGRAVRPSVVFPVTAGSA